MDVRGRTLGLEALREPRGGAGARLPGPHGAPGSRGQPALPPPRAPRFENLRLRFWALSAEAAGAGGVL